MLEGEARKLSFAPAQARAFGAKVPAASLCAIAPPPNADTKQVAEAVIQAPCAKNDCRSGGCIPLQLIRSSAKCAAAERALRPEALESSNLAGTASPGSAEGEGEPQTFAVYLT